MDLLELGNPKTDPAELFNCNNYSLCHNGKDFYVDPTPEAVRKALKERAELGVVESIKLIKSAKLELARRKAEKDGFREMLKRINLNTYQCSKW